MQQEFCVSFTHVFMYDYLLDPSVPRLVTRKPPTVYAKRLIESDFNPLGKRAGLVSVRLVHCMFSKPCLCIWSSEPDNNSYT